MPSGVQACMHPNMGQDKRVQCKKGVGSTQGEGGLYKKLQIPTFPPKLGRSGITFHLKLFLFQLPSLAVNRVPRLQLYRYPKRGRQTSSKVKFL